MSIYSRFLEQVLFPLHNAVRGRNYARHLRFLEQSQWWPREKVLEFQWQELRRLLEHAFSSVPFYQRRYAEAGIRLEDIRSLEDFRRLPPLTRDDVRQHLDGLKSRAYAGKLQTHATGGSLGSPTRFFRTMESYDWRTAATARAYSWTGVRLGERTLYLWGAPIGKLSFKQAIKKRSYELARRELIINTLTQSEQLWAQVVEQMRRFRPRLVVGYVSSLEEFCRYVSETQAELPPVKAAIAAAEPVYASTRQRIESVLRAPLFNTYGSREFMSLAAECERHNGMHVHPENVLIETAGVPEDGESEVLVTDLHNYGMPFIRYEIGDVGSLDDSPCPCGRGLPRLASVSGRVLDRLRTIDGRVVPGEWFPHVMKDIPEVREFQVRQESLERIVLLVVLSADLSERSRALLDSETKKVFGTGTEVLIQRTDAIDRLASGKRRVVVGLS